MTFIPLLIFLAFILNQNFGNAVPITINAIAYSHHVEGQIYTPLVESFNKYSRENNLDIILEVNLLTLDNATFDVGGYGSTVENLLRKKRNSKYELYFYDNLYAKRFEPYLLDLSEHIPEHLEMYKAGIASQTSVFNNHWVGLPVSIEYTVLYNNKELLDKYGLEPPKTWDDLINITKYILKKEKEAGNDDLLGYNGLFPRKELGMCSIYEFIHTFRKSVESPFPDITSEEAVNALNMMKRLKEEIASDNIFEAADDKTKERLANGKFLFLKYWYQPGNIVPRTIMPGHIEGISGTTIGGYNLGIGGDVKGKTLNATLTAFKYMTSREVQKKFITERGLFSGILDLYEDPDVCDQVNCTFFKSFQPIARPTYITNSYNEYSEAFRNYIYEFLYGNKSAKEVLKEIENLSTTHKITLFSAKDTSIGIIMFIIVLIISGIMALSLTVLRSRYYQSNFKFLPNDQWNILILGCILILYTSFTGYGEINQFKCKAKPMVLSFGYALHIFPILFKLIQNLPNEHSFKDWVTSNQKRFFFVYMAANVVAIALGMTGNYNVVYKEVINGNNYEVCRIRGAFSVLTFILTFLVNYVSLFSVLVMAIKDLKRGGNRIDMISVICTMVVDIVNFALVYAFISLNVNSFTAYFNIFTCLFIGFSVTNYILLYGYRIIWVHMSRTNLSKTSLYTQKKPIYATDSNTDLITKEACV